MITWGSKIQDYVGGHTFKVFWDNGSLLGYICSRCDLTMTFTGVHTDHTDNLERLQSMVGPGWGGLVEQTLAFCHSRGIIVTDIKEKYASMRISVDYYDDDIIEFLNNIETKSWHICEKCGDPGKVRNTGWYKTLCFRHYIGAQVGRKWVYFRWRWLPTLVMEGITAILEEMYYEDKD